MQTMHASFWKTGLAAIVAGLALGLAGCATKISNMTSETVSANPSGIYTITALAKPRDLNYQKGSINPKIVIDGQIHEMKPSAIGKNVFEYDYAMPPGRTEAAYYILVNYRIETATGLANKEDYTERRVLKVVNTMTLVATRAPLGARVAIVGSGFSPQDVVYLDSTPARTVYESPNAIAFMVPAVPPSATYTVALNNGSGTQKVGSFRVDPVSLSVTPGSLSLRTGEKTVLFFTLGTPAPAGGLLVEVNTDVPKSVIMPEVIIPAGATSANITVQGGQPGTGSLFVSGAGSGETTVPVTVTAR
jgi:hypothetical protein